MNDHQPASLDRQTDRHFATVVGIALSDVRWMDGISVAYGLNGGEYYYAVVSSTPHRHNYEYYFATALDQQKWAQNDQKLVDAGH